MEVGARVVLWSKFSPCVAIQEWLFHFEGLWDCRWRLYAVHIRCVSRFSRTDNIWAQLGCKSWRNFVSVNRQSPSEVYSGFSVWIYFHMLFRHWTWPQISGSLKKTGFFFALATRNWSWSASGQPSPLFPAWVALSCHRLFQTHVIAVFYRLSQLSLPAMTTYWRNIVVDEYFGPYHHDFNENS